MQNECTNPPLCYYCHDAVHTSTHCPQGEAKSKGW